MNPQKDPIEPLENIRDIPAEQLGALMLNKNIWAVIGAHANPERFGFKLLHRLKVLGYTVYPVNPRFTEVDGLTCYPTLKDLPEVPEVLNMVVNPKHGCAVLEEAAELGINLVWCQPGSYDADIQQIADRLEQYVFQGCVLVSTINRP